MASTDGLDRAARESRGKRMSKLLEDEVEADDEFWNQDAFKEDAEDNEYEAEDEVADTFDSDFDADEPDDEDSEDEDEPLKKKRKLPPGRFLEREKKKREKKISSSILRESTYAPKAAADTDKFHPITRVPDLAQHSGNRHNETGDTLLELDGERGLRKSTRTAVVIKQAERVAHQAALQALSKPVKKKKEEERKISQEEMLLEAAQTEIQNLQALEVMLAREEEVKRKATIHKALYAGPQIRFHSCNGNNTIEFTKVSEFPTVFNSTPMRYAKKFYCVITGLPAKYRDPKSHLPYATKEAFRIIRERYDEGESRGRKDPLEESHQRKRTKVERERLGTGGRTMVTKQSSKKVTGKIISDDVGPVLASSTQNAFKETEPEAENPLQLMESDPALQTSVDIALTSESKQSIDSMPFPRQPDFELLDIPRAFVEANEADFMLDDLEVSLPANLETSQSLSFPPSNSLSPKLLALDSGGTVTSDPLDQQALDVSASGHSENLFSDSFDANI